MKDKSINNSNSIYNNIINRVSIIPHAAASAGAVAAIFIFLGGLFICTSIIYGRELMKFAGSRPVLEGEILKSVTPIIILFLTTVILTVRGKAFPFLPFIFSSVLIALSIYILYNNSFQAVWVSDFQRMWDAAGQLVGDGRFKARNIIEQRALPVLVPAVYIFGHHPFVVSVINITFLIAIMLVGYDILRRLSGHLTAQIFTILWLGGAETAFSLKIPSHDLWGLLFVVLTLWMFVRAANSEGRSAFRSLFLGFIVGMPIILLDVQRELGSVALAAFATTILLVRMRSIHNAKSYSGGNRNKLIVIFIGAIISFGCGNIALKKAGVITSDPSYNYLSNVRVGALAPSYSNGTFRYASTFGNALLRAQPGEAQTETVRSLLASDFAEQPWQRIASVISKMNIVSRVGGQWNFYQSKLKENNSKLLEVFLFYNKFYSLMISVLFIAVLVPALSCRENIVNLYALSFMGVLIGGIVTIGEVQPRYVFPVWFFAPVVIAIRLGGLRAIGSAAPINLLGTARTVLIGAVVLIAGVWCVHAIGDRLYTVAKGRIITQFNMTSVGVEAHKDISAQQLDLVTRNSSSIGIGRLGFSLLAADTTSVPASISASQHVCADGSHTALRFAYVMPYVNPKANGVFKLMVKINNRHLFEKLLPDNGNFHDVAIPGALAPYECGVLAYTLEIARPLLSKSWVSATRTEIYFPRLSRN